VATTEFLSASWFDEVNESLRTVSVEPDARCSVAFSVDRGSEPVRWTEVVGGGSVEWQVGDAADADVEVRWPSTSVAFAILAGNAANEHVLASTTIAEQRADARYEGPLPPFDLGSRPEIERLPYVRDATLRLTLEHPFAPLGTMYLTTWFEEGRFVRMTPTVEPDADVAVSCPWRDVILMRQQKITIVDAVSHGKIGGSQGALTLLAGILEHPAYRSAQAACATGPGSDALATRGEIAATDAYRAALDALFAETVPPS
jgi:hypothetical protein